MNKKNIFSISLTIISIITISACAPQTASTPVVPAPAQAESTQPVANDNPTVAASTAGSDPALSSATLACASGATFANLTPELTEGPYFTAGSPERASLLEDGMSGMKLVITGYVFTTDCTPIANAKIDFWQADANGVYDNSGYTLRGHQFTDASGKYTLTTVVPGIYPGRTEHIHLKVQAPNGPIITSQLFFPGVSQNDSDGIYNAALLISINKESADLLEASYNFVVSAP